jgi:hypothetical protein
MGKYLLNKETQKIELHFGKPEYLALTDTQKKEIKSSFLWSRSAGAWVSRSIHSHYRAVQIAEKLGLENAGSQGERLSYEEELERKQKRAEARADRYETYAENAEQRGKNMQKEFNSFHGDIAFFTQPNINSSAGRAFTNRRQRILDRYAKGFDEYRKSEYFAGRAATARDTASGSQLQDPVYLHNRIKEQNATIKKLEKNVASYEDKINRIQNGEVITNYKNEPMTVEQYETWTKETLDRLEYEIDKLAFFQNAIDEIGGNRFSKDNIKVGYIVKVPRWGNVEVTGTGPVNFTYKHDLGPNHKDWPGQEPYAAIIEIIEAKEQTKEQNIDNPFKVGDILCAHRPADSSIYRAYQVVKTTKTGVKIQRIAIENGEPIKDNFVSDKVMQKKIVKSKWSEFVGVYMDDWQLHKYTKKELIAI